MRSRASSLPALALARDGLLAAGVRRLVAQLRAAARACPARRLLGHARPVFGGRHRPSSRPVSPEPLDRSTIWPYEDGEPGAFYYSRYGHRPRAEAERRLGELDGGHALLFASGSAATTAVLLGLLAPGATVAVAEGCYFGTSLLFELLEPLGAPGSSSSTRRAHRPTRRPRLAGGAVQPVPHLPRLRGRGRPPGAGRRRRDRLDAGPAAAARARRRPRRCTARRSTSAATRTSCSAPSSAGARRPRPAARVRGTDSGIGRRARRRVAPAARALRRSSFACAASPRRRSSSHAGSASIRASSTCATRARRRACRSATCAAASAGCSRSTSPAARRPRVASRRPRA